MSLSRIISLLGKDNKPQKWMNPLIHVNTQIKKNDVLIAVSQCIEDSPEHWQGAELFEDALFVLG